MNENTALSGRPQASSEWQPISQAPPDYVSLVEVRSLHAGWPQQGTLMAPWESFEWRPISFTTITKSNGLVPSFFHKPPSDSDQALPQLFRDRIAKPKNKRLSRNAVAWILLIVLSVMVVIAWMGA